MIRVARTSFSTRRINVSDGVMKGEEGGPVPPLSGPRPGAGQRGRLPATAGSSFIHPVSTPCHAGSLPDLVMTNFSLLAFVSNGPLP